jgi:hypothetical protein
LEAQSAQKAAHFTPDSSPPPVDPDLAAVIDLWPTLPEFVRAGILAMVRAAAG